MSIRLFILLTSALVGLVFVGGSWYAVGSGFNETLTRHARHQAEESARLTQAMLYEVMNTGWYPDQARAFNAALRASNPDTTIRIHNTAAPGATARDCISCISPPPKNWRSSAAVCSTYSCAPTTTRPR